MSETMERAQQSVVDLHILIEDILQGVVVIKVWRRY